MKIVFIVIWEGKAYSSSSRALILNAEVRSSSSGLTFRNDPSLVDLATHCCELLFEGAG